MPEGWEELVVEEENDARLDSYLAARLDLSRSRAAQLIEGGQVLLNGRAPRKRDVPVTGDRISIQHLPPAPSPIAAE